MADITLDKIAEYVKACKRCGLSATRTHAVPGEGCPTAKLMCIGEGPGFHEDQQGRPFVGESGHLLDKILAVSGFSRQTNTFIANIVKCRPPSNRNPEDDESAACLNYLRNQVILVKPEIIVLLRKRCFKKYFRKRIWNNGH